MASNDCVHCGMSLCLGDCQPARDAELVELRKALMSCWADDRPTPEDAEIQAAHPARTGNHERFQRALELVSARHSKGALVDLVNWLLTKADGSAAEERARVVALIEGESKRLGASSNPTAQLFAGCLLDISLRIERGAHLEKP